MNTIFLHAGPVRMTASIILLRITLICSLVPLQKFGGSRLHSSIIGDPIFKDSLCSENPDGISELRNSDG